MEVRDHLGRLLQLNGIPERIVSLVPSQTELLVDLGLEKSIVGITHFCVHPEGLREIKTRVGGTKKVNLHKIKELRPDIILCNKEENTKKMVEELEEIAPVHISDVANLEDAYRLIQDYGRIFNCENLALTIVNSIRRKAETLREMAAKSPGRKVAYFIWDNPLMVAGRGTFINSMLELNNFENAFSEDRYPATRLEDLRKMEIEDCFLSSEPFPFKENHKEKFKEYCGNVKIVNGEYFSWFGSRLIKAMDYFKVFH